MHEFSIAEGVISSLICLVEDGDWDEINEVVLVLGGLQKVDEDLFKELLGRVVSEQAPSLGSVSFVLESEPAVFECGSCGVEWSPSGLSETQAECVHFVPETSKAFCSCPECGSSDFVIKQGRGVRIKQVRGRK